ncbi:WxL domain-containing protein [Companilactobacillus kedongensis]|uniref:WxL domain-containing protein n=1 Tax=Companilactobacillus kedongensis TaxID=2486004 RepID=UPI000F7B9198|nr:WxL domain-containing protein [Companilactobacillus kedongensis]
MKNIKKALFSLLIATSALLTLSTNIVNADTTSATVASDGSSTAADGTVMDSKTSTVSVTVLSGILTLDAVPDFSFRAVDGAKVGLNSNTTDFKDNNNAATANNGNSDGNNTGLLKITDSRVSLLHQDGMDKPGSAGFTLGASISSLEPYDAKDSPISGFELTLKPQALVDGEGNNSSIYGEYYPMLTKKATLSDTNVGDTSIIDLNAMSYRPGVLSANFSQFTDGASFYLPKGSTNINKSSNQKYNAVITWTLTPKPIDTYQTIPMP